MADAWGGAWGAAWGASWGNAAAVAAEQVVDLTGHDGQPRRDRDADRREEFRLGRQALRESVERAYRQLEPALQPAAVAAEVPPTPHAAALAIMPAIRMDGLVASLTEIEALVGEYQAALVAERLRRKSKRDEEAFVALLLAA